MKQSPVQYMFVELKRAFPNEFNKIWDNNPELLESVFQKAREREKEMMCDFATAYTAQDQYKISAKDYYNENFKTK